MPPSNEDAIRQLREAYRRNNLTLYLGAGVSVDSRLPTWEKLVLAMFFSTISEEELGGWRPFPNYLFAIAEWYLANGSEPLEITARKLRKYYRKTDDRDEEGFLKRLHQTLYAGYLDQYSPSPDYLDRSLIRDKNRTLDAVARLCESSQAGQEGVRAVISYNYDNLLELALGDYPCQAVYENQPIAEKSLPIYHVHGFVPMYFDDYSSAIGSKGKDIVFTEDQYHRVAGDPYYWSNLVQLDNMAGSVGLMIGLSLADRNMRRLLDAISHAPLKARNFALLQQPDRNPPEDRVLDEIHEKARQYFDDFQNSGIKSSQSYDSGVFFRAPGIKSDSEPRLKSSQIDIKGPRYRREISGIIEEVKRLGIDQQQYVMGELGITPIWFESFSEIPEILRQITISL